ncbi:hypothetical protein HDU97_009495 [Phlyctochytrium planicorne]|nr:hypothetical protein HDU97_009495 [Phlyctochytrium planicorne]
MAAPIPSVFMVFLYLLIALSVQAAKNYTSSLTLLLVNPIFDLKDAPIPQPEVYRAVVYGAVDDVNSSPHLFPETQIKIMEIDNWNPKFKGTNDYPVVTSGGYSSAKIYQVLTENNITGMVADCFSKSTLFSAGIASQLKVPFCGHFQGSPKLSDIKAYPYFFRTMPGRGQSKHIVRYLQYYNVKHVTLIHGPDLFSTSHNVETKDYLSQYGFDITANILVSDVSKPFLAFESMRRHKSRVIILSMLPTETTDFYYAAAKEGFIGKDFVWISFNPPSFYSDDPDYEKRENWKDGLVLFNPPNETSYFASSKLKNLYWKRLDKINATWKNITGEEPISNAANLWDCVKVMLIGIYQYLQNHPEISVEDLAKPQFRQALDISKFRSTGYSGASFINIEFVEDGGLKSPMTFTTVTDEQVEISNGYFLDDGDGMTDSDGNDFVEMRPPKFRDNSSSWPVDDTAHELLIESYSWMTFTLYGMAGLSYILIVANAVNSFNSIVRRIPHEITSTWLFVIGAALMTTACLSVIDRLDGAKCRSRSYMEFTSFALIYSTTAIMSFRFLFRKHNRLRSKATTPPLFILICVAVSIGVNVLLIWSADGAMSPEVLKVWPAHYQDSYIYECSMAFSSLWSLLYAYNALLVLQTVIFSKLIKNAFATQRFSLAVLEIMVAIATSIFCMTEMHFYKSRLVIENGDFPPDIGTFSIHLRTKGWDLNKGEVALSEKSILGWLEPVKTRIIFYEKHLHCVICCVRGEGQEPDVWTYTLNNITESNYKFLWNDEDSSENSSQLASDLELNEKPSAAMMFPATEGSSQGNNTDSSTRQLPRGVVLYLPHKTVAIMWKKRRAAVQGEKIVEMLRLSVEGRKSVSSSNTKDPGSISNMLR